MTSLATKPKDFVEELDPYCQKILTVFTFAFPPKKEVGFNELAHTMNKLFKMSKPTLSQHLKHLMDLNVIKKRVDERSSLRLKPSYYSLNRDWLRETAPQKEFMKTAEKIAKLKEESLLELTQRLFEILYFGDLIMTRLLIEKMAFKNPNLKAEIWITRNEILGWQNLLLSIIARKISKMNKEEIKNFLQDFDKEMEKAMKEI